MEQRNQTTEIRFERNPSSNLKLSGCSLAADSLKDFYEQKPNVAWVEVILEDFLGEGGTALYYLEKIRQDFPISLHANSFSVGSADELNWHHFKKIKELQQRIQPCLLSDHLAWTSIDGHYLHYPLPLPYTDECLSHLVTRVQQIQNYFQQQILLENIPTYTRYRESHLSEVDFLNALVQQSGCGLLLDVTSLLVNTFNFGENLPAFLQQLSASAVQEIHLSGIGFNSEGKLMLKNDQSKIDHRTWDCFRDCITRIGRKPTIIEWHSNLPSISTSYFEACYAEQILRETYAATKFAS